MATTLTVTFEYMFMLVKSKPPVVLLPKGTGDLEHTLWISGIRDENKIQLKQADLRICIKNNAGEDVGYIGQPPTVQRWPNPDWILDFCNMSSNVSARQIAKSRLVPASFPKDLNGRFWLPYGYFKEAASDKLLKHREQRWEIPRPGKPHHHQWFTDVMRFACKLDDSLLYFLEISEAGKKRYHQLQAAPKKDIELRLCNDDIHERDSNYMDDVELLYALAKDPTGWPLPKRYGTLADRIPFKAPRVANQVQPFGAGSDRPICGAGQGCPEP